MAGAVPSAAAHYLPAALFNQGVMNGSGISSIMRRMEMSNIDPMKAVFAKYGKAIPAIRFYTGSELAGLGIMRHNILREKMTIAAGLLQRNIAHNIVSNVDDE